MDLLDVLRVRFEATPHRHPGVAWPEIEALLDDQRLAVLAQMEATDGEPDVVLLDGELCFVDCSAESPVGRRSLCYDQAALDTRKANKPAGSAMGMAADMGISLLSEAQYAALQALGEFDLKTSSWLLTPDSVRGLGGALFGDRRYGRMFTFHNGADSYYASRGFRGVLRVK